MQGPGQAGHKTISKHMKKTLYYLSEILSATRLLPENSYNMQKNLSYPTLWIIVIFWVILDVVTKILAQIYLAGQSIVLIPSFLSLEYVRNPGIAFWIPVTWVILKIITLILIFAIVVYYIHEERQKQNRYLDLWFALLISGALWNAWERVFITSVTDMVAIERFAVFNLADSLIFLWVSVILVSYYFSKK